MRVITAACTAVGLLMVSASGAFGQSAENVAVVANDASPVSQRIAEYYVRKRGIPPENVVHISASTDDSIERLAYAATIEAPLRSALAVSGRRWVPGSRGRLPVRRPCLIRPLRLPTTGP